MSALFFSLILLSLSLLFSVRNIPFARGVGLGLKVLCVLFELDLFLC